MKILAHRTKNKPVRVFSMLLVICILCTMFVLPSAVSFAKAEELGQQFADEKAVEKVYITDLFRRCGKFREAASICDSELEKPHPPHVLDMLYLERDLIEKGDTAAHSDSEAEELEF